MLLTTRGVARLPMSQRYYHDIFICIAALSLDMAMMPVGPCTDLSNAMRANHWHVLQRRTHIADHQ
jgi:hypothetical protein